MDEEQCIARYKHDPFFRRKVDEELKALNRVGRAKKIQQTALYPPSPCTKEESGKTTFRELRVGAQKEAMERKKQYESWLGRGDKENLDI